MKRLYTNYDRYFLLRYPLIWNSRLHFMLPAILFMYLLYWLLGISSSTLGLAHCITKYDSIDVFFSHGYMLVGVLLSLLLLIVWGINYFKHNSFKSYYPNSSLRPFKEYLIQFFCLFFMCMFWLPFFLGHRQGIRSQFSLDEISPAKHLANIAHAFIPKDKSDYMLWNRCDTPFFSQVYEERVLTGNEVIEKHSSNKNINFEFWTLSIINTGCPKDSFSYYVDEHTGTSSYSVSTKSALKKYYGDRYVDAYAADSSDIMYLVLKKERVAKLPDYANREAHIRNYSRVTYSDNSNPLYNRKYFWADHYTNMLEQRAERSIISNEVNALLNANDPARITGMMNDFIKLTERYGMESHLKADAWYDYVCGNGDFTLDAYDFEYVHSNDFTISSRLNRFPSFELSNVFENIEEAYADHDEWFLAIGIIAIVTVFVNLLLFSFRMLGLKGTLWTVLSTLVIGIIYSLLLMLGSLSYSSSFEEFSLWSLIVILLTIISLGVFLPTERQTLSSIIRVGLTTVAIPTLCIMLCLIEWIPNPAKSEYNPYINLFDYLNYWSMYAIIGASFIAYAFYSKVIWKWKALPKA